MTKELFEEYANLKEQEKEIEAKIDELKPKILSEMEAAETDKVETEQGNFTITKKKTWTFTEKVHAVELQLDSIKDQERADGSATFEEKPVLMFKAPKV